MALQGRHDLVADRLTVTNALISDSRDHSARPGTAQSVGRLVPKRGVSRTVVNPPTVSHTVLTFTHRHFDAKNAVAMSFVGITDTSMGCFPDGLEVTMAGDVPATLAFDFAGLLANNTLYSPMPLSIAGSPIVNGWGRMARLALYQAHVELSKLPTGAFCTLGPLSLLPAYLNARSPITVMP